MCFFLGFDHSDYSETTNNIFAYYINEKACFSSNVHKFKNNKIFNDVYKRLADSIKMSLILKNY